MKLTDAYEAKGVYKKKSKCPASTAGGLIKKLISMKLCVCWAESQRPSSLIRDARLKLTGLTDALQASSLHHVDPAHVFRFTVRNKPDTSEKPTFLYTPHAFYC